MVEIDILRGFAGNARSGNGRRAVIAATRNVGRRRDITHWCDDPTKGVTRG
jgi:hypothetical protein